MLSGGSQVRPARCILVTMVVLCGVMRRDESAQRLKLRCCDEVERQIAECRVRRATAARRSHVAVRIERERSGVKLQSGRRIRDAGIDLLQEKLVRGVSRLCFSDRTHSKTMLRVL